jgi:hypothetical protein
MSAGRKIVYAASALVLAVIFGAAGGCAAHRRPSFTAEERQLLSKPPLPYSVTIVEWDAATRAKTSQNPEAYARSLADVVIPSRAFREVRRETSSEAHAELAATSTGEYCNTAIIPVLSIFSVGIIPTVWQEEDCEGMFLRSTNHPDRSPVRIDVRFKGTAMMGWASLLVGALPGWSWGDIRGDSAYHEMLRLEVTRRRAEIERLVAP